MADASAWARASSSEVAPRWIKAARAGDLVGLPVVTLELLHDTPDRQRVEPTAGALAGLRQAPVNRTVTDASVSAVRELASRGAAGYRVRLADALVAAAATDSGVDVLHYDHHFDRLAEVLGFTSSG